MRQIELTKGYAALVDDEDYERVSQFKWWAQEKVRKDGSVRSVCAKRWDYSLGREHPISVLMHRFVLGITDPKVQVDHRDNDGLHNWRSNLRTATNAQNRHNSPVPIDNTSGFKGVSWDKNHKVWTAYITAHAKRYYLGSFSSVALAAQARAKAETVLFGEFARPVEVICLTM